MDEIIEHVKKAIKTEFDHPEDDAACERAARAAILAYMGTEAKQRLHKVREPTEDH
jgi:hypothetical protein